MPGDVQTVGSPGLGLRGLLVELGGAVECHSAMQAMPGDGRIVEFIGPEDVECLLGPQRVCAPHMPGQCFQLRVVVQSDRCRNPPTSSAS